MKNIHIILIVALLISGCQKTKQGITSSVKGRLIETGSQRPIINGIIKVDEYKYGFMKQEFIQTLASGVTDEKGDFSVTYTTSGKGNRYRVSAVFDDKYSNIYEFFVKPGKDTSGVTLTAILMATFRLRVIVKDNPVNQLNVIPSIWIQNRGFGSLSISGKNNDTTITLRAAVNLLNGIDFSYADNANKRFMIQRDTFTLRGTDTPYTKTITVEPSKFTEFIKQ